MIYCDNTEYESYINAVGAVLNIFDSTTDVEVEFSNKLTADAGGYCSGDLEQIDIEIATHVQGEALSVETIQRNIAHEMIHAQQIITGRLEDLGLQLLQAGDAQTLVKVSVWDGETYTNTKYDDQPWEIDAYAREEEVMLEALQYV